MRFYEFGPLFIAGFCDLLNAISFHFKFTPLTIQDQRCLFRLELLNEPVLNILSQAVLFSVEQLLADPLQIAMGALQATFLINHFHRTLDHIVF